MAKKKSTDTPVEGQSPAVTDEVQPTEEQVAEKDAAQPNDYVSGIDVHAEAAPPADAGDGLPEQIEIDQTPANLEHVETPMGDVVPKQVLTDEEVKTTFVAHGAVLKDPEVVSDAVAPVNENLKRTTMADAEEASKDYQHTRFGEGGKEVPAEKLSNPAAERHNEMINPEFVIGRVNEYPR